jgi:hypothetical protein
VDGGVIEGREVMGICQHSCLIYFLCPNLEIGRRSVYFGNWFAQLQVSVVPFVFLHFGAEKSGEFDAKGAASTQHHSTS